MQYRLYYQCDCSEIYYQVLPLLPCVIFYVQLSYGVVMFTESIQINQEEKVVFPVSEMLNYF